MVNFKGCALGDVAASAPLRKERLGMYRTVVDIDGMMCGMCESHVNDAVRNNFKVKKVSSSHSKGRTVIESEAPIEEAKLREIIDATGYEVQGVTSEEIQKKGLFGGLFGK